MIYMDWAATSWPKPLPVRLAVAEAMETGGNPGRSSHRLAVQAARLVLQAREAVAALLGEEDSSRIAFTANATGALNLAIAGLLRPGDHVITGASEHNSVMRPLRHLEEAGVALTVLPCDPTGLLDPDHLRAALRRRTRLCVFQHASNVLGGIQPLAELGRLAREAGSLTLVDAAQTAGSIPLDINSVPVDLVALPGHKGLMGPQGTGALWFGPGADPEPLLRGGTGSRSESELHPDFLPDRLEVGTPNVPGLAGLAAGIEWVQARGVGQIRQHESSLIHRLIAGLAELPGAVIYGPPPGQERAALVTVNLPGSGLTCADLAWALAERFGIMTRPGLHCAPAAHRVAGTWPEGGLRFSLGPTSTEMEVEQVLAAMRSLCRSRTRPRTKAPTREVRSAKGEF